MSNLSRKFLLIVALFMGPITSQAEEVAGVVERLQGNAFAMQDALPRPLNEGVEIFRGDVISTGKGARLEIRMLDDAVMTLSEKTIFVVTDYISDGPEPAASFRLMQGAFKAVSGKIAKTGSFVVATRTATIGIRGTTFWGGSLDGNFEVALLDGKAVYVENKAGRVELTAVGQGTKILSAKEKPSNPTTWSKEKTDRAIATISFK